MAARARARDGKHRVDIARCARERVVQRVDVRRRVRGWRCAEARLDHRTTTRAACKDHIAV
jgi:hypothetical protein